jgi:undecaprenyl-diphosphatase
MKKENQKRFKSISLKVILTFFLLFISIAIFILLTHWVVFLNQDWFDSHAFRLFESRSSPSLLQFSRGISFFGSPYFLFPAYLSIIILLLLNKRRTDAIDIGIIAVTSTTVSRVLKMLIGRARPEFPFFEPLTNHSFPSGHAFSSFVFCSVLIWLIWNSRWQMKWKWTLSILLLLLSFSIGVSRIVLRYHYASDVIAGFSAAFAWVLISLWIQKRIRKEKGKTEGERAK